MEVAARQVLQQRLRTHHGGAVQTLAALEKGLHSRLSKCSQARERRQPTPGRAVLTSRHENSMLCISTLDPHAG